MTESEERDYLKAINKLKRKMVHPEDLDSGNLGRTKRWVRQRMIGRGEFGKVFLARPAKPSSKLPPIMAVKSADFLESAELAKESRLLKKFRKCPFILDTYGSDLTEDVEGHKLFNVFLEYAQRGTVEDWIQKLRNIGLFEQHVRKYTVSLLKGLNYIHEKGFVHCDIKPANIFLVRNGPHDTGFDSHVAKIGDFGLSKRAAKDNVMKRSDDIQGTGLYMSAEVTYQNIQEPPADIWALGCCVLQMLTGKEFWDVNTDLKDDWGAPIEIPIIPEELNDEAKDFLGKCFVMNPLERYTAEMLLKHAFVRNTETKWTVSSSCDSRVIVVPSRVCQQPAAIPLIAIEKDEWEDPTEIPIIPEELNDEAKDFLGKCFRMNPLERYTAEMLLKHPFV